MRNTLVWQIQLIQKAICHKLTECLNFTMIFLKLINFKLLPAWKQTQTSHGTVKPFPLFSFIKKKINRDIQDIISSWPCKSWQKMLKNTFKRYCKAWSTGFLPKLGKVSRVKTYACCRKMHSKIFTFFQKFMRTRRGLHSKLHSSYYLDSFLQMYLLKWFWNSREHRTELHAGKMKH